MSTGHKGRNLGCGEHGDDDGGNANGMFQRAHDSPPSRSIGRKAERVISGWRGQAPAME